MVWLGLEFPDEFDDFIGDFKVSKWPRPNSKRIQCDFRMALGDGIPFPRPDRYFLDLQEVPDEPDNRAYALIDLDVSGPFEVSGSTGVNALGREITLKIIQHLDEPIVGQPWPLIEYQFISKMAGFDDFHFAWYWPGENVGGDITEIPFDVTSFDVRHPHTVVEEDKFPLNLDWPTNPVFSDLTWRPKSSCFAPTDFIPEAVGAEFNGVDAYIGLDHSIGIDNGPFFFEADVRLRDNDLAPMLAAAWHIFDLGISFEQAKYGNRLIDLDDLPAVDTWFKFRMEFEWSKAQLLTYHCWIDDVEQSFLVSPRFFLGFDNLGVRDFDNIPVWGDFDMKNLIFKRGTFASPTTVLDMKLIVNALDDGPDENHGTTHNMALPSI